MSDGAPLKRGRIQTSDGELLKRGRAQRELIKQVLRRNCELFRFI
jgi:hypothetical protein